MKSFEKLLKEAEAYKSNPFTQRQRDWETGIRDARGQLKNPTDPADNDRTRSQIKRDLSIITRKTGTDYMPILMGLRNDQHALGLLSQLLQDLMTMNVGVGKSLSGRMV